MMLKRGFTNAYQFSSRLLSISQRQISKTSTGCYKSQYSIDKLYPNSDPIYFRSASNQLHGSTEDPDKQPFSGYIPIKQLQIKHTKGSGPGGQNVNKVNTKVEIRFHVESAEWMPKWIRSRVLEKAPGQVNKQGFLIVTSDTTRKQILNQAECLNKLREIIFKSSVLPKEETKEEVEVKEKRISMAKKSILREKKRHSLIKQNRQSPGF